MLDIDAHAAKALSTIDLLSKDETPAEGVPAVEGATHRRYGMMKLQGAEIGAAAGIAFVFSKKAGLGLSVRIGAQNLVDTTLLQVSHGSGFVLAKLSGKPGWSAPLPFHVTTGGLGVTIGYSEVDTVLVLDCKEAVDEFLKTQVSLDSHLNLAAGSRLSADASETALDVRHPANSFKRFAYSVSKGAMIDASWNGAGISINDEDLKALYGEGVKREDVLAGKVETPQSLAALYAALNRLAFFASHAAVPAAPA